MLIWNVHRLVSLMSGSTATAEICLAPLKQGSFALTLRQFSKCFEGSVASEYGGRLFPSRVGTVPQTPSRQVWLMGQATPKHSSCRGILSCRVLSLGRLKLMVWNDSGGSGGEVPFVNPLIVSVPTVEASTLSSRLKSVIDAG